jgi:hypothetical protein
MSLTLLDPIIVNTAANFTFANVSVTANISAGNVRTDNLRYANGTAYVFTTNAAGSNTQIQFNNANSFAGSGNLTFNITTNTLSVTNITANGAGLTNLNGSNVAGQVANALVSGTVYTNAQPNITSVGTLTSLSVTGNISAGNLSATTFTGSLSGAATSATTAGTVTTNAQPNITSVGTLTSLAVTGTTTSGNFATAGNITASFLVSNVATGTAPLTVTSTTRVSNLNVAHANVADFISVTTATTGNAFLLFANAVTGNIAESANSVFVANSSNGALHATTFVGALSGAAASATTAGTVTTNAQPNITSVGTLTGLTSNGVINLTGASNVSLGAVDNVKIIGGTSNQVLRTDGAGNLSWVAQSGGGGGNSISNGTSNISIPTANGNISVSVNSAANVVVFDDLGLTVAGSSGNISGANFVIANNFSGNGSTLSGLTGANVVGQVANALISGTVYTNAQPNITSVGTLLSLNVTGFSSFFASQDRFTNLSGATGIVTHDLTTGAVFYHTGAAANFTPNFTNVPAVNNFSTVAVIFIQQGGVPYMPTATTNVQIAGSNVTVRWAGGIVPTGTPSGISMISYSLIRNAGAWIALGQGSTFA